MFDGLHQVVQAQGTGSQGQKLAGLVGLLERATAVGSERFSARRCRSKKRTRLGR